MDVVIEATVQRGARVANKNIKSQLPKLISQFPELKDIHTATINLRLDKPLLISKFERTTFIRWWDVDVGRAGFWHPEEFSILPIKFEYPINGQTKDGWLFVSHDSGYFRRAQTASGLFRFEVIEVVTEQIAGLQYGHRCKIYVEKTNAVDAG